MSERLPFDLEKIVSVNVFFCPISRGKIGNKQSWVNTDFSLDKITRESRLTRELPHLLQTS